MVPKPRASSDVDPGPVETKKEILYDGYWYDVEAWSRIHPGGKIIEFYTTGKNEDATLAVEEFHYRSMKRVKGIMNSLKKRPATLEEIGLSPEEIQRHKALDEDFKKLHKELEDEGLFKPSLGHLTYRLTELIVFAALGIYLCQFNNPLLTTIGVFSFGLFQGRSGWLMHEGGHHSLTGVSKVDRFIQAVVFGVGSGMSSVWWSSQHNRHHAMPQRHERDVDLETLPLIAFNKRVVKNPKQGKNFFIQHQNILFLAVDTFLVAFMWKLYLHPRYILLKKAYNNFLFMAIHYYLGYQLGFVPYLISVWIGSIYIFGNFSLSHTHLPVTTKPTHWIAYALTHTADVEQKPWCNWWMSFLNYQIEHHLFPTMPQFRHPLIVPRVKALAKKHNLPYVCFSYLEAVSKTYNNLSEVSKELKMQ